MNRTIRLLAMLLLLCLALAPAAVLAAPELPPGATVTSATLSVYVSAINGEPVYVHRITSDWAETNVTWNNFAAGYDPAEVGMFLPTAPGWYTVDVTAVVAAWANLEQPNYGFLLAQHGDPKSPSGFSGYQSSDAAATAQRPKLEICYDAPVTGSTCVTVQRPGAQPVDAVDATIDSSAADSNYGLEPVLQTGEQGAVQRKALLRFFFRSFGGQVPAVAIIKYTNGVRADDPNGLDVPVIAPGDPVIWTYKVTNMGALAIHKNDVVVEDDNVGVVPVYDSDFFGNFDDWFEPGEEWLYKATGVALDLENPGTARTVADACTRGGTSAGRTAYINQGRVTIPGATATADSSYCNPGDDKWLFFIPVFFDRPPVEPDIRPFRVTVGYEDLPLFSGNNDYDYNDWIVRIEGEVYVDPLDTERWKTVRFNFEPGGRGAVFNHSFHLKFLANTFASNGTATLVTRDVNGNTISTEASRFNGSQDIDLTIFPDTRVVFPEDYSNTLEARPLVAPQRTAVLTLEFDRSVPFDLSRYNFTIPHGTGLFFDPYIRVKNTGDVVKRGESRILNVSEQDRDYIWPEERIRIDRAYPDLRYIEGTPPTIIFPDRWWAVSNSCVMDGRPCGRSE